jgi:hypothetical protein
LSRRQRALPDPQHQVEEARIPRQVGADHQGVDEEPDEVFYLLPGAPGHRYADGEILDPSETAQESLIRGQGHHERSRPELPGEVTQPRRRRRSQVAVERAAAGAPDLGPRPVGRQLEDRWQTAELPAPERQLVLHRLAAEPAPLPDGVVAVLHRQVRQGGGQAGAESGVESCHLVDEDLQGALVADDVVHGGRDDVVAGRDPQQDRPEQRPALQIEGSRRLQGGET